MAPKARQVPEELDHFNYLLQPGTEDLVEYIPVDDFFDQYLELLNFAEDGTPSGGMAKGARIEATERSEPMEESPANSDGPATDSGTGTVYGSSPPLSDNATSSGGEGGAVASAPPPPGLPPTPMSRSGSDSSAAGYAQTQPPVGAQPITSGGMSPITSGGMAASSRTVGGPPVSVPPVGSGLMPISSGAAVISGMPDQLQDRKVPQPKQRRRRVRDERQQMLNKLAQIRYRERKKGRVEALEGEVSALEAQLAEMQVRQAENADLVQQNRALAAQIEERDAAIEEARAAASGGKGAADAGSPTVSSDSARGGLRKDSPEDLDQLVKDWLAKSREIIDLVEMIGLGDGNKKALGRLKNDVKRSVRKTFSAKTRDSLKHVEQRLDEMVNDVTTLCMRVMRLQGAQVQQLMTADPDMVCSMKGWKDEGKWLKAARELNFTTEQRKRVLAARDEALSTLNQLYGERQALNAQVLNGLSPGLFAPSSSDAAAATAAREMVRLLDALAANLAAEQRELARQDFVLFRQLLTPVQAGLLVSISFPDHCDALALLNGVYAEATS